MPEYGNLNPIPIVPLKEKVVLPLNFRDDIDTGYIKPEESANKREVFYQNTAPTGGYSPGDIWIDTDDSNHTYRANESYAWVSIRDGTIVAGATTVYFQANAPSSGMSFGDLWVDSDDNKLYRYSGSAWGEIQDDEVAQAIADAANAQSELDDIAADNKITPIEKLTIKPLWDAIVAEKSDIDTQADTYSVSKTAYGTAYTNLNNYLNTTLTVFANMAATTNITRADWDGFWKAYFNAKIEILQAIADAVTAGNPQSFSWLTAGTITSKAITLAVADGTGDAKIQAGKTDFGDDTAGFILGIDDSDGNKAKFEIGNASNYLKWTGSALNINGVITATSGAIGGFIIGATTLYSISNEIILDSGNKKITVGTSAEIVIDGANKKIESSNYVSGVFGAGFHLDSDLLEVGNIAARGLIRTAVFQKDVISVVGGSIAILDGDVLDANMTADDDSTLTTKGTTTFLVGDILRIKDGTNDEWMEVTNRINTNIDSYGEINSDGSGWGLRNGANTEAGQTFTNVNAIKLDSCKFYLLKSGSPTGNATAVLYAMNGTYGTNGKPTGSILATSDNFDVSTLTGSFQLITFTFTGVEQYLMTAGTYYCIALRYSGGSVGNSVNFGTDNSSPSHSGNFFRYFGSYTTSSDYDSIFYVYGVSTNSYTITRDKASDYTADNNPTWKKGATVVNYKQSGDGGVYMTASDTNAPYLSIFDHAGAPWTTINTRLRIGNLNGYLGYSSDIYGLGIGSSSANQANLTFDSTNGIRIRSGTTNLISFDNSGNALIAGWSINQTTLANSTNIILDASNKAISINSATFGNDGIQLDYNAGNPRAYIGDGSNSFFKFDGTNITWKAANTELDSSGNFTSSSDATISNAIITAGIIRTATSGQRVEMNGANNRLEIFNSSTSIGYFGNAGANGNFIYINQPDTNEDYPPVYITSAQDSNVFNIYNTNASLANRPAFRIESNNASSEVMYVKQTADENSVIIETNANTNAALHIIQLGTNYLISTNVAGCYCNKAGIWQDASSKKIKENFEDITVLDKLDILDIKKYNYIIDGKRDKKRIKEDLINRKKREIYSKTNEGKKGGYQDTKYLEQKLTIKELKTINSKINKEYIKEQKKEVPKYISPMAEDFYKMFGLGSNEGIAAKNLAGVALQAIKELNLKVEKLIN